MLGAYPTDPYFDPQRPSWLPYWIDDPTESELKYGSSTIIGAVPGAAVAMGQGAGQVVGGIVGGAVQGSVQSALFPGGGLDPSTWNWPMILLIAGIGYFVIKKI